MGLLKNEAWGIRRVDFLEHPRVEGLGGCPGPRFPNAGSFYLVVRAASTPFLSPRPHSSPSLKPSSATVPGPAIA